MSIVAQAPEKRHEAEEIGGASGGPAEAGDARWLLRSPDEGLGEWLDRIRARLAGAWQASDPRDAYRRGLWGRALILAQARLFGARDEWKAALEAIRPVSMTTEDDDDDDGAEAAYAVRCAYTARSFPEVAAAVLGLDVVEVCRALALAVNNTVFTAEEAALVGKLSFREFWRRRGNPHRARAELLALARRQVRRQEQGQDQEQEAVPEIACRVLGPGAIVTPAAPSFGLDEEPSEEAAVWNMAEAHPEPACQVLPAGAIVTRAVTRPEREPEKSAEAEEEDEGESTLLRALFEAERRAADVIAALIRATRVARAEDPEAADSALARTVSLLASECMADWEVALLLRLAQERVEAAEDAATRIAEQAENEAAQIRAAAWREAQEARQAAAAAATVAYRTLAWREVEEKVARLLDRYRLRLAPPQEDGLDGYRETVRVAAIARRAIPMVVDATLSRLFGRAGADLAAVIWSDFGAAEAAAVNVDLIARHAEELAAVVPDLGLAQEHVGLPEELAALDYPRTASGFISVAEALAARRGGAREETRAAVAAARAGRGRPVVPVAP